MAKRISSLSVLLTGDTTSFSGSMKGAAGDVKNFGGDVDKAKSKVNGFFKDLKSNFGRSSTLGQSLKVLAGGGAIMALGKIASEFDELTKKAEDFAMALDRGDGSANQMAAEL